MKITLDNYESYFLDYAEGNLDDNDSLEFEDFLQKNPDLQVELDQFTSIHLKPQTEVYTEKNQLKKTEISIENISDFETKCIARVEGDLTAQETAAFDAFLESDTHKSFIFSHFVKTKLIPDFKIIFSNKEKLKKRVVPFWTVSKVAMAVAAMFILFVLIYKRYDEKGIVFKQMAWNETSEPKTKDKKDENTKEQSKNKENKENPKTDKNEKPTKTKPKTKKQNKSDMLKSDDLTEDLLVMNLLPQNAKKLNENTTSIALNNSFTTKNVHTTEKKEDLVVSFRKKIIGNLKKKFLHKNENDKVNFWDIAEVGVKKFNKLTESDITISNRYDENGKLLTLDIASSNFEIYRDLRKK